MTLHCPKCDKPCDAGSTKSSWSCKHCGASGKNGFPGNDGLPAHQFTVLRYDDGRIRIKRPHLELWEQLKLTVVMLQDMSTRLRMELSKEPYDEGAYALRLSELYAMDHSVNRCMIHLDTWKDVHVPAGYGKTDYEVDNEVDSPMEIEEVKPEPDHGQGPQVAPAEAKEWGPDECDECGEDLSGGVKQYSENVFGVRLCQSCQDNARTGKLDTPKKWGEYGGPVCYKCGTPLNGVEIDHCSRDPVKYGDLLYCEKCQKVVA